MKTNLAIAALLACLSSSAFAATKIPAMPAVPKTETTASGIAITVLKEGSGESPKATDTVKVHYRGTLLDGKEFDSSYKRGEPTSFPLNRVIPCWTEGVQTMKPGGKVKLVCPSNLAYGARGVPGLIPADSPLVFEVELLSIGK
jgi:FKBP-type peptidyl-prolyl cis-trans isomerase FkpA